MQEHELDPSLRGRLGRGERLGDAEIVELADRRVAGGSHLPIRPLVRRPNELRRLPLRLGEHRLAPGPEVACRPRCPRSARWNVWLWALTNPESGARSPRARDATSGGVGFAVVAGHVLRSADIPNALTIARFAAIPVFVWLYLAAGDGPAWGAGMFFAAAALTDQLDGYLARRWHVESAFGKVADPLADRLMIGTAAVLLLVDGPHADPRGARHPRARPRCSSSATSSSRPRGYELEVTFLGKLRPGSCTRRSALVLVTARARSWPVVLVWIGVALASPRALQYARTRAMRAAQTPPRGGTSRPGGEPTEAEVST